MKNKTVNRSIEERNELVEQNLYLVNFAARPFLIRAKSEQDCDDIKSVATLGLIDAAAKYDPSKGKFNNYAVERMSGAILDFLREKDVLSRTVRDHAMELVKKYDQGVSLDELNKEIRSFQELQPATVKAIQRALHCIINGSGFVTSLENELPTTRGAIPIRDLLRYSAPDPAEVIADKGELEWLDRQIESLPDAQRVTIIESLRGKKNSQIAATLGVSEGRVTQIRNKAAEELARRVSMASIHSNGKSS